MVFFEQILKIPWAMHPRRFWLIWFMITGASLIYVMSVVGQVTTPRRQNSNERSIGLMQTWRQVETPKAVAALMLLAVLLASYIAMIVVWQDFTSHDADLFMLYTLKGNNYPLPIWQDNGRFFPFGMQEFNLIRHLTNTPVGYFSLSMVQLLILFCILLNLDVELKITARVGLAILALITPSILFTFDGLVYEERNVIFLLACLLLSIKQFERTREVIWAAGAVLCAQIMLYEKETAFLLLFGFAAGKLVLRCRDGQQARWNCERLWDQESRLDLCLASLAALFLLSYFAVMGIHPNMDYAINFRRPVAEVVFDYLRIDLLVWLFIGVVLIRIYRILWHQMTPWPLWDGLALGGAAYLLAYLYLGMFMAYYLAPVDLIAVLYVGRCVLLSWKNMHPSSKLAALTLASAVVLQSALFSAFAVFETKNEIHGKVAIASVVEAKYRNVMGDIPTLFFPFARPYSIMEFAVYLSYRGVPINSVKLARGAIAKDYRCIKYRDIKCHSASKPVPGDLVVVLPEDEASLMDASVYREQPQLLFLYEPHPRIPHWLYPLVDGFSFSWGDYNKSRPDRWMDASVSVWR